VILENVLGGYQQVKSKDPEEEQVEVRNEIGRGLMFQGICLPYGCMKVIERQPSSCNNRNNNHLPILDKRPEKI
jgi:hypothetical protein